MKKVLVLFVAALGCLFGSFEARATHVSAAEILYEYTGIPNRWLVTLKAYRDCSPGTATMPTSTSICYHSPSLGISGSFTVVLLPGSGQQVPPTICVPPGTQFQCYEEYVYQGTITLPQPATDWKFMWQLCCMNNAINTIQGPGGITFYTESTLNSVVAPTNNSPTFAFIPITRWCINNQYYYSQGTTEIDGDDIEYSLVSASNTTNSLCPLTATPVTYINPYSPTNPISTVSGFGFNTLTGVMDFVPNLLQIGLVCVDVKEFRNGIQVGSVRRVIQANVIAGCAVIIPQFTGLQPLPNGLQGINAYCGDTTLVLQLNTNIQCGSIVPTDIRVTEVTGFPNPVINAQAINCVNNLTNTVGITIYNPLKAGLNWLYTKVGNDGNTFLSECGSQMPEFDSIPIWVVDTTTWSPSQISIPSCSFNQFTVTFSQLLQCNTIAPNLSDWVLKDAAGTTVPITSISSSCQPGNPLSYSQTFTFNITSGNYINPLVLTVKNGNDNNTIANYCGTLLAIGDTMAIINFLNGIPVNLGPDLTECATNTVILNAGWPGTYTWTYNGSTLTDTTQTITVSQPGTYTVFVSQGGSCVGGDTIVIDFVQPPAPFIGNDITICDTDPLPLLDCGVSGAFSYQWFLNGNPIPGATGQTYQPIITGGTYSVVVASAPGCTATADITITISPGLQINLGNDLTFCENDPLPLLDAGVQATTFQWLLNGNVIPGATGQTYQPTQGGTYTVNATSVSGCTGTDQITININLAPVVSIGPDTAVCVSENYTLNAGNAGSTYQWYLNGNIIPGATGQTYTPTQSGIYSVVVTNANNCDNTGQVNITVFQQAPTPTVTDAAYCSGSSLPVLDAGLSGFNYQWYTGGNPIPGATGQTYQPSSPGTYTVVVSVGTCTSQGTATITEVAQPSITSMPATLIFCQNDAPQTLTVGTQPVGATILWSTGDNLNSIQVSASGTYTATVTISGGGINCTATAQTVVTVNQQPVVDLGTDVTLCEGDQPITLEPVNAITGTYVWSNGATTSSIQTNQAGTYTLTVTDQNGCVGEDAVALNVNALPSLSFSANLEIHESHIHLCKLDAFPLLTINTGSGIQTFSWFFNNDPLSVTGNSYQTPSGSFGTYMVEVVDSNGCRNSTELELEEEPCDPVIPNIITPNFDGLNDNWVIDNFDPSFPHKVVIFNRWGQEVFSTTSYQNDWYGKDYPDGTYYYVFDYNGNTYKGTITKLTTEKE